MDFFTEYRRNSQSIEHSTSTSSWSTASIILSLLDEDRNDSTRVCDRAAFALDGGGLYFSFVEDRCLLDDELALPA
jgi:hypothetical protein